MAELVADLARKNEAAGILVESAAKGFAPVDTGRLRASITHDADETGAVIGTNVEYAPYVELGTVYRPAKPFLTRGLLTSKAALVGLYGRR